MNTTVMAGEVTAPKKVTFADRKNANSNRIEQDEKELQELMQTEEKVDEEKEPEVEAQEAEPVNAEEKSFKKRYGDLRRHQQTKEKEYEERIKKLEQQLVESTKSEIKLPKSDEDIEAWAKQYPDVAGIVETIAIKKALEQSEGLEETKKEIDELKATAARERAEVELMKIHPDFGEIRDSDDFHNWAEEQPKWVQEALYENSDDPASVVRVIDLYKVDKGISVADKRDSKKAAASTITKGTRASIDDKGTSGQIKESDVARMSTKEFEERQDEIAEAMKKGKFIYDVSK